MLHGANGNINIECFIVWPVQKMNSNTCMSVSQQGIEITKNLMIPHPHTVAIPVS